MLSNLFINYLFVISVILIWFMLGYQLLLFLLGFYYSRKSAQEKVQLAKALLSLPRVSLIIPARNEALVIKKTLESILASEYPCDRLEVIVVNDGSTDKTAAIVNEHIRVDARVKLINIPPGLGGRGKSAALNIGLRHAKHEIIGVYDA